MEAYKLIYEERAKSDVTEIIRYIALTLKNQTAAIHIARKIRDIIERTTKNPHTNAVYFPVESLRHEYRKIVVDNYLIFYRIEEETRSMIVCRVIYGKRDIQRKIKLEEK